MPFVVAHNTEDIVIFRNLYRKYWEVGFRTRLYEMLSPQAYLDSLERVAQEIPRDNNGVLIDLGCGSGMLIGYLQCYLEGGGRYVGMDILEEALMGVRLNSRTDSSINGVHSLQVDLLQGIPVKDNSIDCVVGHFFIYTLGTEERRIRTWQEISRVLKPGGKVICVNASKAYYPERIVQASLHSLKGSCSNPDYLIKKYWIYPLARILGLRHVKSQLMQGYWHAYTKNEMEREMLQAGLKILRVEPVYGGSAWLAIGAI